MTIDQVKSETPSLKELTARYNQLAYQLGSIEYQVRVYQAEAANLVSQMQQVNQDAAKFKAEEAAKVPHPAPTLATDGGTVEAVQS